MNQTVSHWTKGSNDNSSLIRTYSTGFITLSITISNVVFLSGAVLNIIVVFIMIRRSGKIRQNISSFLIFHLSVTHLCYFSVTLFYLGGAFYALYAMSSSSSNATVLIDFACAAAIFSSLVAIAWYTELLKKLSKRMLEFIRRSWHRKFYTLLTKLHRDTMWCLWLFANFAGKFKSDQELIKITA